MDRRRAGVSAEEPRRRSPVSGHAVRDLTDRALGLGLARLLRSGGPDASTPAFNYPASSHTSARSTSTRGDVEPLVNIKGPTVYTVTSLARDPETRHALLHHRQRLVPRSRDARSGDRPDNQLLQKDARIGDLVFSTGDKSLWGIRHLNGLCTLVRIPPPYRDWEQVVHVPLRHRRLRPRRLAGWLAARRVVRRDRRHAGRARALDVEALTKGDATPVARFDFGTAVPNDFVFSPDGRYLYGSSYLHRRLEHLSLRDRDGHGRRREQYRDRVLPADSARRATS